MQRSKDDRWIQQRQLRGTIQEGECCMRGVSSKTVYEGRSPTRKPGASTCTRCKTHQSKPWHCSGSRLDQCSGWCLPRLYVGPEVGCIQWGQQPLRRMAPVGWVAEAASKEKESCYVWRLDCWGSYRRGRLMVRSSHTSRRRGHQCL